LYTVDVAQLVEYKTHNQNWTYVLIHCIGYFYWPFLISNILILLGHL